MAKRVVILGAGYGGVKSALTLAEASTIAETEIVVVNKHDYHQFITELHESATGYLSSNDIRVPLTEVEIPLFHRWVKIGGQKAVEVIQKNNHSCLSPYSSDFLSGYFLLVVCYWLFIIGCLLWVFEQPFE